MNEKQRRAVIWNSIERTAFKPASNKECKTWLALYTRSLSKLWQLQPAIVCGSILDQFTNEECRNYFKHCNYRYT